MFLRNAWYVAGFSSDLAPGQHVGRKFLNQSIVLFRGASGRIGAVEDRCCHRAMPLSEGHVDNDIIRCCYHGLEFDASGACTKVPGQDRIPPTAVIRSYPIVERDAVLWIWMGDVAKADPATIPSHPFHTDPGWGWKSAHFGVNGNWELLVENLMDLSHLGYVHARTIGGNANMHFRTKTEARREGNKVMVTRHMPNSVAPPTYVDAAGFKGPIDRWQEISFEPVLIRIHTGGCDAGTGAYEGRRDHGFSMQGFHGVTPETDTTTHYFWSIATNIGLDRGIPDVVFEQTAFTFKEDQVVLEAQQKRISETPDGKFVNIASDAGSNLTKRLLKSLFEEEATGAVVAA
ncbi:aromatic ring-hydroxylating dioxygenase subunit alpha [Roseiarcaceae bacterium H3SJ34-1]|uniref:aromatic ring-hydroxylating dioxygenase subunit alpha n=1 Tax=Terripilifer ovatus TaxID=3032367 RepID=UPI003AB9A295|nr:aromatic ring-hydroxylating dioxygenase subunit alpha [Roseiarcaceae bacterium H3SJ34-1]